MEDKIINYLERFPNSKAKVISKALGIDKSRINSLLYGKLKNIVQSNKQYEWSLKKSTTITSNNTFEKTKAETKKLELEQAKIALDLERVKIYNQETQLALEKKQREDRRERAADEENMIYRFNTTVDKTHVNDCMVKLTQWSRRHPKCDMEIVFSSDFSLRAPRSARTSSAEPVSPPPMKSAIQSSSSSISSSSPRRFLAGFAFAIEAARIAAIRRIRFRPPIT